MWDREPGKPGQETSSQNHRVLSYVKFQGVGHIPGTNGTHGRVVKSLFIYSTLGTYREASGVTGGSGSRMAHSVLCVSLIWTGYLGVWRFWKRGG